LTSQSISVHGSEINASVVRTNRIKTATVKVVDGQVSIVVPHALSDSRIQTILKQKKRWIREKLYLQNLASPTVKKEYVSGESFSYLGRNYRLKIKSDAIARVKLVNGQFEVRLPKQFNTPENIHKSLENWFRERAVLKFQEKVDRYAEIIGVTPKSVQVRSYRSRWGSCSMSGRISFNWKVIIAPNRVVDYVVVHELCHLVHHNHGSEFWRQVRSVLPDYEESRLWLKDNGGFLCI